jgi:hypothetical protein
LYTFSYSKNHPLTKALNSRLLRISAPKNPAAPSQHANHYSAVIAALSTLLITIRSTFTNRSIISTPSATFLADLLRRNHVNNTLSGPFTSLSTSAAVASARPPYHTTISALPEAQQICQHAIATTTSAPPEAQQTCHTSTARRPHHTTTSAPPEAQQTCHTSTACPLFITQQFQLCQKPNGSASKLLPLPGPLQYVNSAPITPARSSPPPQPSQDRPNPPSRTNQIRRFLPRR